MKTGIISLFLYALLISTGCSQSIKIVKGYAYARNIIGGVKPNGSIAEDGSIIQKRNEPGVQYFIYVSAKDTAFFPAKNIRIGGTKYSATAEAVNDLPVVIQQNEGTTGKSDTLFNTGKFRTWKINVGQMIPPGGSDIDRPDQQKESEVLIGFLSKRKMHYYSIAKIKYLEAVRLQ